jgi:hypothetical protein
VGNANELNAGYAADGYGRLRGMSALITTFGVGELSAANAIAGSYAEHVLVVHIVGAPPKDAQGARRVVHHSLGDGDYEHSLRIAREITCAQANLAPATATREIDRVLSEVREQKLPGYLLTPSPEPGSVVREQIQARTHPRRSGDLRSPNRSACQHETTPHYGCFGPAEHAQRQKIAADYGAEHSAANPNTCVDTGTTTICQKSGHAEINATPTAQGPSSVYGPFLPYHYHVAARRENARETLTARTRVPRRPEGMRVQRS